MTGFLIGLFTAVLVLDCIVLILLVLIQLPKKEAGLGLAFGGGAADALFGAGSGTVLTKATKYAAGIFFCLAVILGTMQSSRFRKSSSDVLKQLENAPAASVPMPRPPASLPEAPNSTSGSAPAIINFGTNVTVPPPAGTTTSAPARGPAPAAPSISTNPTPPK